MQRRSNACSKLPPCLCGGGQKPLGFLGHNQLPSTLCHSPLSNSFNPPARLSHRFVPCRLLGPAMPSTRVLNPRFLN